MRAVLVRAAQDEPRVHVGHCEEAACGPALLLDALEYFLRFDELERTLQVEDSQGAVSGTDQEEVVAVAGQLADCGLEDWARFLLVEQGGGEVDYVEYVVRRREQDDQSLAKAPEPFKSLGVLLYWDVAWLDDVVKHHVTLAGNEGFWVLQVHWDDLEIEIRVIWFSLLDLQGVKHIGVGEGVHVAVTVSDPEDFAWVQWPVPPNYAVCIKRIDQNWPWLAPDE